MVIDETRKAMYIWRIGSEKGFTAYELPSYTDPGDEKKYTKFVSMEADAVNTTSDEGVFTCQLALDKETGRVYFCFRPDAKDSSKIAAGICYYDPDTKKVVHYGDANDLGMGICINPNKSKLF